MNQYVTPEADEDVGTTASWGKGSKITVELDGKLHVMRVTDLVGNVGEAVQVTMEPDVPRPEDVVGEAIANGDVALEESSYRLGTHPGDCKVLAGIAVEALRAAGYRIVYNQP